MHIIGIIDFYKVYLENTTYSNNNTLVLQYVILSIEWLENGLDGFFVHCRSNNLIKTLLIDVCYVSIQVKEVIEMEKMIEAVRGLKEFRKKWGLTQVYCAKETGVSLQAWNLWERGANRPSLENWEKLEKFLAFYEEE